MCIVGNGAITTAFSTLVSVKLLDFFKETSGQVPSTFYWIFQDIFFGKT